MCAEAREAPYVPFGVDCDLSLGRCPETRLVFSLGFEMNTLDNFTSVDRPSGEAPTMVYL